MTSDETPANQGKEATIMSASCIGDIVLFGFGKSAGREHKGESGSYLTPLHDHAHTARESLAQEV